MDKLFNSHWFVKIISFFIALMLFTMVNLDNVNNQPGLLPTLSSSTHTVGEVPLTVYYDEENYSLIDQTETVQVTLTGSQTAIQMFQMMRPNYEVFVDVTAQEEGTHTLQVEHRGFRNDVTVAIVPEYARVVLQEKQTYSLPVTVELVNEEEVEEGYSVGTPIVTPVNVTVKAARDAVAEVATAKAYVNISEADGSIEDTVPVKLYDRNGNELSLETEPSIVEVKVPITSPNKTVPIKITREGELPDDLSLESLIVEPREVTIFGPTEVIDEIDVLEGIILDLSELEDGEPVELEIPLPEGIEQVEPETLMVTPTISEKVDREFEDLSLEIVGESAGTTVSLASGEPSTISVVARGALSRLEELTREDIQVFIDVSQEGEGEHEVEVQINGPRDFAFVASQNKITVNIRLEESDD
ncbi:YbbR-like domain-containing protein [Alkalihalobacillus sp. 1P02AB]|uniref:CdaR family protein n=1 Tax=Alkalihalobacillus sp. 1P02AB TaxID=3132260 RepID=UPI0039A643F1